MVTLFQMQVVCVCNCVAVAIDESVICDTFRGEISPANFQLELPFVGLGS